MISNDNKGQIQKNIGSHLLYSFSQQGLSKQSINRKDKENYIEIKKVVEGQSYKYSDYQSNTLQTFTNFKQTNINNTLIQNCESNNEYCTKMSVKQLSKSKENLIQNQYSDTHNFRSKSTSPQLISQNYQKSDNINIQFIKNQEDQRIKNIAEGLKSKIQSNLNNKLKNHFIQQSKQIQSRFLPNQDLVANYQNQVQFHNSCLSLKEFFHQKSIELKQKFLEQQSQLIEEKVQIISNKAKTTESTKKSLSRSYDISINTQKKIIYNKESISKLRNDNDSNQTKLLNSSNLIPQQNYSINYNHQENQTQIQSENIQEDNYYFSLNKKFGEQNFNEKKNQNLSKNHISMSSPISLSSNTHSQNKLITNDERNSPLVLSNKVNRYMNLIQSFKSFQINQTQLKNEIEIYDSIQVNDLNHISEFSIFKDEKQNHNQNLGLFSEIEQQISFSDIQINKDLLLESNQFDQQYIQRDFKQDYFNDGIKQIYNEQTKSQYSEQKSSLNTKKIILQKQESCQYNQLLNK
ncbi:unnamed protein product [Paramecium pentaurelia]|uniref:Uncharacterized protein n=1 Tax=Paramecium pentaurelia TaxID=43138 RepID=A0A8S1S8X7_9CILI|nr:unnamed protein product [Paramecium pentaurelia]